MKGLYFIKRTMSSSGESSDSQIVRIIQPTVSSGASSVGTDNKGMESSGGGVVCQMGGASHLMVGVGGVSQPPHPHQDPSPLPDSASSSSSPQYTVEEQVTTVRIPMRRPNSAFLEILHEGGAHGEVFTMGEIIHHVKNYIIRHQLYDRTDPRVVHCRNHKLGHVFEVDQFTINEAVPLFMKHTLPVPDSCIRIRRQLVKKAIDSSGAASAPGMSQDAGSVSSTVTSTTETEESPVRETRHHSATAAGVRREGGSTSGNMHDTPPSNREKGTADETGPSKGGRRTSVNIEYGDEVDGATPMFQVNMETNNQSSEVPTSQAPEEDSVSVQYDSDHFAVEYELDSSDHRSESEHSSHGTAKDFVVVQKESDVEFWADYSETETNSDTELGDADQWQCETCQTFNVPFYRNCSKCWALRPHWLPDSSLPSSSSSVPLPSEPCGSLHGYYAQSSNDEQLGSSHGNLRRWHLGDKIRRRRVRVMSASSSERSSESLVSLSEDDAPSTSAGAGGVEAPSTSTGAGREDSGMSSVSHLSSQQLPSSQETVDSSSQSQPTEVVEDDRKRGGGKARRGSRYSVAPSADECMVCASRPKTGCIIHGSSGHQVCCYRCAKRLWRKALPCPVCRRPIQKVIKNFVL